MNPWKTVLEDQKALRILSHEELTDKILEAAGWGFFGGILFTLTFVWIGERIAHAIGLG